MNYSKETSQEGLVNNLKKFMKNGIFKSYSQTEKHLIEFCLIKKAARFGHSKVLNYLIYGVSSKLPRVFPRKEMPNPRMMYHLTKGIKALNDPGDLFLR